MCLNTFFGKMEHWAHFERTTGYLVCLLNSSSIFFLFIKPESGTTTNSSKSKRCTKSFTTGIIMRPSYCEPLNREYDRG
jgi:hypothetical protein